MSICYFNNLLNSVEHGFMYTIQRKSMAVMSIYDAEGIIDDYVLYYLNSLRKATDRVVVAVNGYVNAEGKDRLQRVADDIFIRPNRGFDFGAFKDVLENDLQDTVWKDYQEIILCNDSCFGPFVPFEEIFHTMRERNLEFWSINYRDNILIPYYESYFMVFSGRALVLLRSFLDEVVDGDVMDMTCAQGYEHYLSESVMQQGILSGCYTSGQERYPDLDIYRAPDYVAEYLGLPFLKKKSFSPEMIKRENCYAALAWIKKNTDYPIEYIERVVRRKYDLYIRKEDIEGEHDSFPHYFWKFYVSREKIISYCREHERVYIYGRGYMSIFITAHFRRYMNEFGGYIVSDEYYTEEMEADGTVLPLSEVGKDAPIIVALLEERTREVFGLLESWNNVVWLSVCNDPGKGRDTANGKAEDK